MKPSNIQAPQKKYPIGVIIVVLTAFLLCGCAASPVSLQPEIKSADMASALINTGHTAKAVLKGDLSRKLPAMSAGEHEGLGDRLLARGQLHSAYLHYEKALQLAPENIGLEYKKGLALLKAGKAQEAAKQFRLVPADHPLHALACEGMGRAYLIQKDFSTSQTYFIKAVSLDKTLWLSHNYLGAIHDRQRQWAEALNAYRTAIELRPHEGSIYNNIGMSYLMAKQYASALTAFQEAISREFNPPRVYNNLGMALAHLGYADAALEAFGKAGGQARAYNNLGCIYLEKRQLIKAIACFEKAIAADPVYYVKASENLKRAKTASEKI